jgi:phage terminase large subunit-like protein
MNPIREYWQHIQEHGACDKLTRVYAKLIADMDDPNSIWEYQQSKADHVISFIEKYCKHSKGALGGQPFELELWQKAIVAAGFGFVHKIDQTRRFRQLLLFVARKNGKSMLGSALALYMLIADSESGPEVVSAATKREQAKIIWLESKRMVKKSPALLRFIKPLVGELVSDFNDGSFKPLASDSNTLDGLNIHALLLDELHAIEDQNLLDVLVDGMSAREQPMSIITTTMGTVRESVFDLKYEECERIINGYNDPDGYHDERTLPIIYELDKRSEWTDPKCWHKANPGLGTIKSLEQLADKVRKAQSNPLLVKNLLCKDFNVRETTSEAWLTFEEIDNPVTFDLKKLKPRYGIGGADLSATTDLTAASVLFMVPNDPVIYHMQMFWLPEDLLDKRTREDKIPYDVWRDQGLLRTCPGNSVHAKYVTEWFQEVMRVHGIYIPWVGYDSWSAKYWVEEMATYFGIQAMVPVIQGKKTLSGPMKRLGADLGSKLINYGNNPITKWCLTNTSVEIDKNNNIQPAKGTSQRRRIDGTAAMLNAYVVLQDKIADYKNML